jgi:hypothetical protein
MNKVFELGGWQYMDGVSIHTYTTPRLPEAAGLPEKLAQVRALIRQYKPSLELFNTETGTYVAPREEVDRPIPPARLQELIDKYASPTLAVSSGWPNYALDETTGSLSIVRNATYNLAAGAKRFIFFGWNPQWPNADWWTRRSYGGWQLISATKDGKERTPNLYTLAMGVLSAQLEPALTDGAAPIDVSGVRGAIFKTANGGSVAVAWSLSGTRTAAFRVGKRRLKDMDVVSLFGQKIPLQPSQLSHGVLRVELGEQPMYLHLKKGLLRTQASPFGDIKVLSSGGGRYALRYSLSNRSDTAWKGKVEYSAPESWNIEPQRTAIRLDAGQSANFSATVTPAAGASGTHTLTARLQTPDGENYTASFAVQVHPTLTVTATNIAAPLAFDAMPSSALLINRLEQVTIGRAAGLASLQDPKYWLGPDELSAQVKTEYSAQGLSVAVRVHDVNFRPPTPWPGVGGSAVELFFDFRRPDGGLGSKHYGNGVYQFILKPPSKDGDAVNIWFASGGEIAGAKASGTRIGAQDYTVQLFLPWKELGVTPTPNLIFGMDVAVDGAASGNAGRKSQIVLFGTADNFQDASTFALASLNFNPLKGE